MIPKMKSLGPRAPIEDTNRGWGGRGPKGEVERRGEKEGKTVADSTQTNPSFLLPPPPPFFFRNAHWREKEKKSEGNRKRDSNPCRFPRDPFFGTLF